ncbi:MAG: nucleotidyltransferase family protein [Phycisphaerales bacterium]|jgi:predicted nucleotidyltransferase|nr:nucleotidyltransferase family protein [Phycisphaerales bacterium]
MSRIEAFCHKWNVRELSLFGSILRDDFRPDSDVDVLFDFEPHARRTLLDLVAMREELSELLGRPVDLISRKGIERSHNTTRRDAILSSARVVYTT